MYYVILEVYYDPTGKFYEEAKFGPFFMLEQAEAWLTYIKSLEQCGTAQWSITEEKKGEK